MPAFATDPWGAAAAALVPRFGAAAVELRYYPRREVAAVRVTAQPHPVLARHAEPPDPPAPWTATAACGSAVGWVLAEGPPDDPDAVDAVLVRAVERHTALRLQQRTGQARALGADLLESLTHRLLTDVVTLESVADGALTGAYDGEETEDIRHGLRQLREAALERLAGTRDVMNSLRPDAPLRPEPLVAALTEEFAIRDVAPRLHVPPGEVPTVLVPGVGWATCARLLADALATDERLGGADATVSVAAHPDGWCVRAGPAGAAPAPNDESPPWTETMVGDLLYAGDLAAMAGGAAGAYALSDDGLLVELLVPAAAST